MATRAKLYVAGGILVVFPYLGLQLYKRSKDAHALTRETLEGAVATVSVVHAKPADPVETLTLPGNVEAWFQAPIYAQVSGYVRMWYKDYGAEVKKGDVLAEINTPTLNAQYEQARAETEAQRAKADLADLTARRYSALQDSHAVAQQAINVREADARVAQAELKAAQQNVRNYQALLKFTTIVAPYEGIVISRKINVGDYVNKEGTRDGARAEGSELFTVADIHKMRLFVSVPESFGQFLQPGLKAEVTVPQFPNRRFVAEFLTVSKGFGPDTRTAVTEFTIDNDDHALWPGSYATVRMSAKVDRKTLIIPSTALVFDELGTQVATVAQNKVHFKRIHVSRIMDGTVDVDEGITLEDPIIDNPSAALLEGDDVRIVTPAPGINVAESSSSEASEKKN